MNRPDSAKGEFSSKGLIRFIWKFVLTQKAYFFWIYFLSLAWSLDATLWPYILRHIIDTLNQFDTNRSLAWPMLKILLFGGFLLWILVEVAFRIRDFMRAHCFSKLEAQIRMAMFEHVQRHSPHYFNENFAGSLSNKINDMVTQVSIILMNLMVFLPAFATCVLSIVFFAHVSGLFALILTAWIVIHYVIIFAFTPKCADYSNVHGEVRSTLAGKMIDSLTNNFAVNLFFRFRFEKALIKVDQNREQEKNYLSQRYVAFMYTIVSIVFLVGGISLNGFMIYYWLTGKISTGQIIQVFNTTWNVIAILWISGEIIPQFFKSIGIVTQAYTVMQDPQDVVDEPGATELKVNQGEIVFKDVSFFYGEKKIFENKSVSIKGGENIGLVGYSGSGKSTFVNLILRFHSIKEGQILIDDQDIAQVTLESLRNQVSLIPQDPILFHRTLEDNIRYGRIDATDEEVLDAAKHAHCHEFIEKRLEGYKGLVGERGSKLSGGERQRIAIARAMLAQAPILILDEATSALDSITEKYIQDSLDWLMKDRTTIVVAHRLSTLAKMDRILVFDHGAIVEEGSHKELMAKDSHYANLWKMQAGGFISDDTDDSGDSDTPEK